MRYSKTTISLLAFLCGVFVAIPAAQAATITVTSDSGGIGGPDCTLRDAITAANTDTATGGCVAGNGADTIELPARAVITLPEGDNWSDGPTGLPAITSEVIINGNESTIERDEADKVFEFRIFAVEADGVLTLKHLTVSNGSVSDWGGGGILNLGSLTLTDSTVSGNLAGCCGGGILNHGILTMTGGTLSNNEVSTFHGGGILNLNTATATLTNSTISGNFSSFHGGGIANAGTLTLINSTISGNVTGNPGGGGFWTSGGVLTLTQSTVCGNLPDQIDGIYTDNGGNLVADECPPCPADLDGDGAVGASDLAQVLGAWGPCEGCPADFDGDGDVDAADLAQLLGAWGICP
ncbi:MAG: right-handed parallel beta-helix repeat-containing protein [Planctomycetes bacterium]|nr:right-handed parallel beta-helix repeat-containing protein [Planctomycetota bacterium]